MTAVDQPRTDRTAATLAAENAAAMTSLATTENPDTLPPGSIIAKTTGLREVAIRRNAGWAVAGFPGTRRHIPPWWLPATVLFRPDTRVKD